MAIVFDWYENPNASSEEEAGVASAYLYEWKSGYGYSLLQDS